MKVNGKGIISEANALFNRLKRTAIIIIFSKKRMVPCSAIVISYPKSGRTWLRTILAKYMELEYGIPFTLELNDRELDKELRIEFTHFIWRVEEAANCKKVLLFRNPKDIIVSHYHHCKSREKIFNGSINEFIRDYEFGISSIVHFMNEIWERYGNCKNSIIMSYEGLHKDVYGEVSKLIVFLGLRVDDGNIKNAIKFSEFKKMQRMERTGEFGDWRLKTGNTDRMETFKVRKGIVGGYKEELGRKEIEYLDYEIEKSLNGEIKKFLGF